jgi:hypothetical protein
MTQQPPALTDRRTIIVLDLDLVGKALKVAKKIAEETGSTVILRDADGVEIDTIYPTQH